MKKIRRGARLGQHFLKASWAAELLADSAHIQKGDTVVEIGPGEGALTGILLQKGARVIAIEKDEKLVEKLNEIFAERITDGSLRIISDDIRDVVPEKLGVDTDAYIVAANIPYYITGEIIRQFLSSEHQPRTMALLVQKEVAERIARSKKESILSLSVKVYGEPVYVKTVGRGNFSPPPSVDSAILSIDAISRKKLEDVPDATFFRTLKAGFSAKRKILRSNLLKIAPPDAIGSAFQDLSLPENVRAEDVPLETWLALAKRLS